MELSLIQKIILFAPPVILAITVHEAAHGYAARYFGDFTADKAGRITLNPLKHIDLFGTILLPAFLLWSTDGKFSFGWAKPVPVNFAALRSPKKDMLWVAAAGPASNLVMAIIWAMILKFNLNSPESAMALMAQAGISINIVLMVLNLLPLPPLDGGRIAVSLLPHDLAVRFAQIERFGFIILIALMLTGVLGKILDPLVTIVHRIIFSVF